MPEPEAPPADSVDPADAPPAPPEARPPSALGKIAVVLGLLAVALVQPIFDLMGRNPAFFVAGRYTSGQIIVFGLIVVVVPAVVLIALTMATYLFGRWREIAFGLLVAALGFVFGNVLARGWDLDGGKVALISGTLGALGAYGLYRLRAGRMLLQYLAVANVLFLVSFLFMSPTSELVTGSGTGSKELGAVDVDGLAGPVVVVVFDEFPLDVIMNPDGTVNRDRYPNLAELADTSTWYRNASSDHHRTERAVPELLTGVQPPVDALPSYLDLPRNLLTLFATAVPVQRYEAITDMCPPTACEGRSAGSVTRMVKDASVVYGHRLLPKRLRAHLPAIDQAWGGFGTSAETGAGGCQPKKGKRLQKLECMGEATRSPYGQALQLEALGSHIVDDTPALYFGHVILPHRAYSTAPAIGPIGGDDPAAITTLMGAPPELVTDAADPAFDWSRALQFQRASLQSATADVALGTIFDQLKEVGAWEDATVVVMADHGVSLLPPLYGRDEVTPVNEQEVYRVPLFMKGPGQTKGEVVDDPASTLDMLPTLIDLLDIETDWTFDGHSLLDGSEPTVESRLDPSLDGLMDLVDRHAADVPPGDWTDLARVGEHADLVGRKLTDLEVGSVSDLDLHIDDEELLGDLPATNAAAPQTLNGSVSGTEDRPPELVVSVNGTIAGAIGGYQQAGGGWRFGTVIGPYLRDGANEIVAYEVGPDGVLHPLG